MYSSKIIILVVALFLPFSAFAKRSAPPKVTPIEKDGIRYIAPNLDGQNAIIEALDIKSNTKLWKIIVFKNKINPSIEEDVQWIFIKKITYQNGLLWVTSESNKLYKVDVVKKTVRK